jgi:hypothetical protein
MVDIALCLGMCVLLIVLAVCVGRLPDSRTDAIVFGVFSSVFAVQTILAIISTRVSFLLVNSGSIEYRVGLTYKCWAKDDVVWFSTEVRRFRRRVVIYVRTRNSRVAKPFRFQSRFGVSALELVGVLESWRSRQA